MGLDGYRYFLPMVTREPTPRLVTTKATWSQFSKTVAVRLAYEELPKLAVDAAIAHRSGWITTHIASVSEMLAQSQIQTADMSALLAKIETDATLVHAAYYTDDNCIHRIANWIAHGK